MPGRRRQRHVTRGLRFRLMAIYALVFAVILIAMAGVFRARLSFVLDSQATSLLDQEWDAMKGGYLRIEQDGVHWYYDDQDPDETLAVERLRRALMLTDASGTNTLLISTTYDGMKKETPAQIQERVRAALASERPGSAGKAFWDERYSEGQPYLVRAGIIFNERHTAPFYIAIGTPLAGNVKVLRDYTLFVVGLIPAALIVGSWLGWFMAGRALQPVLAIAQTAQRISGSNLSLRLPTRDANDELDYLVLTFNRMIDRLEASFQQSRQFSADVSHELRTPITAIRGQLEVALFTAQTVEQYREAMVNALQDIDRLSQIVRALLLLSQAESGQLVLQRVPIDMSELVQDLTDQFQIPAEAAGVHLAASVPGRCMVAVDRVQIERMISNLLSNAVKFTPEGGDVHITVKPEDDSVELVVEDTGRGIPQQYLPHIFDRFYRVPGSGSAPGPDQGLGLGLSFVAWIVKAHEGIIQVDSTPGKGTRFRIQLPKGDIRPAVSEPTGQPIMNEL